MVELLLVILFSLRGTKGKPSLWELDSNYSLYDGSNGDDSHVFIHSFSVVASVIS